jgi:cobyrinic acid a,c-diamide synthase
MWSPLGDRGLPDGIQGLYLGGGFPEMFAGALAENQPMRQSMAAAVRAGMPVYAECGGLMTLCNSIVDFEGKSHPMVGVIPTNAVMGKRLTLGYRQATALQDGPLLQVGDRLWGHEFHRSTLAAAPESPLLALTGYDSQRPFAPEGWHLHQIHASYVHVHFGAQEHLAQRFLERCERWNREYSVGQKA